MDCQHLTELNRAARSQGPSWPNIMSLALPCASVKIRANLLILQAAFSAILLVYCVTTGHSVTAPYLESFREKTLLSSKKAQFHALVTWTHVTKASQNRAACLWRDTTVYWVIIFWHQQLHVQKCPTSERFLCLWSHLNGASTFQYDEVCLLKIFFSKCVCVRECLTHICGRGEGGGAHA